jgi:hypothetical protein
MTLEEAQDQAAKEWNEAFDFRSMFNGCQVGNINMVHLRHVIKRSLEIYGDENYKRGHTEGWDDCNKIHTLKL